MKRDKIIYWIATGLVSVGMLFSAAMYLTQNPELIGAFNSLGLPLYFVLLLGVAKLLGAIALLTTIWTATKEWAYAGFAFTFIGATWIHIATRTPWIAPFMFLLLLGVSYVFWKRTLHVKVQ